METATVEVEELEEELKKEGRMVVTNMSTMMNTMLGHIRLPGQEEEEELDLMMVETEERSELGGRQPGGSSDILTGVFFSLLAFRWQNMNTLCLAFF